MIGLFPFFLWVSAIAWIAAVIIAALKLSPSKDTIYNSHFKNIVLTAVLSAASLVFFFVVTVLTFGLGLIITIPVIIAAFIWFVYRIVKGMMRLNEGRAM